MFQNLQKAREPLLFCSVLTLMLAESVPATAHADFFRRTSLDAVVHWETASVQLPVDPALVERFGPEVLDVLEEARSAWDLGGPVPTLELVREVAEGDRERAIEENGNWIGFAPTWTFGDKLAVTVSTFDADTGALASAQVWINPELNLGMIEGKSLQGTKEFYDLQGVLTHELGHVLGLGEADEAPEATMFPTFKRGETRQRTLSETDEEAVDALYTQVSANQVQASKCSSTTFGPQTRAPWALWFCALAGILTVRRVPGLLQKPRKRSATVADVTVAIDVHAHGVGY